MGLENSFIIQKDKNDLIFKEGFIKLKGLNLFINC